MTEPKTWILPASGAITYRAAAKTIHRNFVARILEKRGTISVTLPPQSGQGAEAKSKTLIFDLRKNLWTPSGSNRPETDKALQEAVGWFNGESAKLTAAHRLLSAKPFPYDLPVMPPMPSQGETPRETWAKIGAWIDKQAPDEQPPPDETAVVGLALPRIASALAALPRPVPIRLSLLEENFEGAILLHLIVPLAALHPQAFIEVADGGIQSDADRSVSPEQHRRAFVLSQALAVVSGLGMFLTDPGTRVMIVIEFGNPARDFPSSQDAGILVSGDFAQILREIETSPAAQLDRIAGVEVSGDLG